MFGKKKTEPAAKSAPAALQEKPTPAFLREDYPFKAVGEVIKPEKLDRLDMGAVYEIKCPACEMAIRSQGVNIKSTFERLQSSGCIGCGNKELVVRAVDMSAAFSVN